MENGTLYGIGVGPGDPELMTLKALKTARNCDIIAVPNKEREKCFALRIALGAAPELAEKEILTVDMPMTKDPVRLENAYTAGADLVAKQLANGKSVGFLTLGDPTVYSTYLYIHERVSAMGYPCRIIPGVPSFCAAAAELGISLCENKDELHVIPGTYNPVEALKMPGTKVLMKNNLPETLPVLRESRCNAMMVERASLPEQKLYHSAEEIPEDAGYFSLLIVKGEKA